MISRYQSGFTIIELAIVLTIVGFIIAGVVKGLSLTEGAKVNDAISIAKDLSAAVNTFKKQYKLLPGDFGISSVNPEIPNVEVACLVGGSNAGNNDGIIDFNESKCVPEILLKAGLLKANKWEDLPVFASNYGLVNVITTSQSNLPLAFPPSVTLVVEFQNLPCAVALEIDRKIDNGVITTGNAIGTTCLTTDVVAFFAVALL